MSVINSDPWFGRGTTLMSGVGWINNNVEGNVGDACVGSQKVFTDADPRQTNTGIQLSNRLVTCIAVRNTSGAPLLPGAVVKFKKAAILTEVDGVAAASTDAPLGVVDEYLPTRGVANNDVFWLVVAGPTAINTAATLAAGALVTVTAGAAATGSAANAIGAVITAPAAGKVRTLVNAGYAHGGI
jgi:hypothetical protein